MEYLTHTEEETKQVAAKWISQFKGGEVVFLHGDLGSGKTTFVRGVAEHLGFTDPVRSPSYTIVNRYKVNHDTIKAILHIDLYRIESPEELLPLALEEELGRPDTITFIEWAEKGKGYLPAPDHQIILRKTKDGHQIIFES